jgi:Uma2 family endonuclease
MSTADLAKALMTAKEFATFVAQPGNEDRWFELARGEVIELPPPKRAHGSTCGNIAGLLYQYKRQVKWGDVTANHAGFIRETDPDTVRGPDIAYYESESNEEGYSQIPPLLTVEVLSPDDKASVLARKVADFLNNGVALVWVVDPATRTVVVYRQGSNPVVLFETDEITGEDVLPGFRCRVADFFPVTKAEVSNKPGTRKRRRGKAK